MDRTIALALLSHIDALMPAIEKAIAAEWKRGNYINGPQFAATLEAFRAAVAASADTRPEGEDPTQIGASFTSGAVPEGQTP